MAREAELNYSVHGSLSIQIVVTPLTMLVQLHIKDLAIIDDVELSLGPGLNVLTGETGAGKSIIVGAAGLLRGGRASTEMIRTGSKEAVVEALFDLSDSPRVREALEQSGVGGDGAEVLIRRVVARSGRSRISVNGSLYTVAMLRALAEQLIDISGQHESHLLSDRSIHRRILDAMGVAAKDLSAMGQAHSALREAANIMSKSRMDERQHAERLDFLRYQLQELTAADLKQGEDKDLAVERRRLQRSSELAEVALEGEQGLYSQDASVLDRVGQLKRRLDALLHVDPTLEGLSAQLEEASVLVEDVALSLRQYAADIDLDPRRLDQVEERLDLIHRLGRKHGGSVDEILVRQEQMEGDLADLESLEHRLESLEADLAAAREQAETLAARLTASRKAAASKLGRAVTRHLSKLRMKGARLVPEVTPRPVRQGDVAALCFDDRRLGASGWDAVEFLITTNPGEPPRPLSRVASGGELSRVMLALRRVLGQHDPVSTSIFDEVDAGIGGAVADVVGRYLAEVARHRQVLCVTHLPQVAAHARLHLHVGKQTRGERARTTVKRLDPGERVEELARMLGGKRATAKARANAEELLEQARKVRG